MAWIGGIFRKVNMSQDDLRKKLAVMMETVCPANELSTCAYPPCISPILDDVHGRALVKVSVPTEGTLSDHAYADYLEKLALIYDGHLYSLKNMASKPPQVQQNTNETTAEFLAHLLADLPGSLEQKVRRASTGLDGDYALAVGDTDRIVISRASSGTRPLYFGQNKEFSAFASNKKP